MAYDVYTPKSTALEEFKYDRKTNTLLVKFDKSPGRQWKYEGVPGGVVDGWPLETGCGSYFNAQVRGVYKGVKITLAAYAKG